MDLITVTQTMYARESGKRRTEGENRRGQPGTGEGLNRGPPAFAGRPDRSALSGPPATEGRPDQPAQSGPPRADTYMDKLLGNELKN